jgi:hypothetical protein
MITTLFLIHWGLAAGFVLASPDCAQAGLIPSPAEWVAFSADAELRHGEQSKSGKFYRSSDGSTRLETGPADRRELTIKNSRQLKIYHCVAASCTVQPLGPARESGSPPKMRADQPGLTKLPEPVEGFEAYQWESGTTSVVLPGLNFFAVRLDAGAGTERYWHITVGEQPAELFVPPAGAVVTEARRK